MTDWYEAVQRTAQVKALYSDRHLRAEGIVVAYSIQPQVCILTPDGDRVWWRADMTELPTDCICCGHPLIDGKCAECDAANCLRGDQ